MHTSCLKLPVSLAVLNMVVWSVIIELAIGLVGVVGIIVYILRIPQNFDRNLRSLLSWVTRCSTPHGGVLFLREGVGVMVNDRSSQRQLEGAEGAWRSQGIGCLGCGGEHICRPSAKLISYFPLQTHSFSPTPCRLAASNQTNQPVLLSQCRLLGASLD